MNLLDDLFLLQIAQQLGEDWYTIGLLLHIDVSLLLRQRDQLRVPILELPVRMFELWRARRNHSKPEIPELCLALADVHRNDLVQMVRSENRDDGTLSDLFLRKLSEHLVMVWKDLGIYLGLSLAEMDNIEAASIPRNTRPPGHELLTNWRNSSTKTGRQLSQELIDALTEMRRMDLVLAVKKHIDASNSQLMAPDDPPYVSPYVDQGTSYSSTDYSSSQAQQQQQQQQQVPSQKELMEKARLKNEQVERERAAQPDEPRRGGGVGSTAPRGATARGGQEGLVQEARAQSEASNTRDNDASLSSSSQFSFTNPPSSTYAAPVATNEAPISPGSEPYLPPNLMTSSSTYSSDDSSGYHVVTSGSSFEHINQSYTGPSFEGHRSK